MSAAAVERVRAAYARIAEADRPEVWIALRDEAGALGAAAAVDDAAPLAGLVIAVKDNIDVAGLPTTAGCPQYAYNPVESAPAVQRLLDAGAVVLGKTNLDQFATGLVGTRSPYGAVRDARRPDRVSGGSSSGSAVAVALGIVDAALGTDTAGSGRVPAAFQGIVGIKPTRGLVPTRGVVPACRTLDCVTVFAADLATADRVIAVMAGPDAADPLSRAWPDGAPCAAPPQPRVAVPDADGLAPLTPAARDAFAAAAARLATTGAQLVEVTLTPFLAAARLLYDGALVAERHAAVGAFVDAHRDAVDPTVGAIIAAAGNVAATRLVADTERVERLRLEAMALLDGCDALLLPTTTAQPTIAAVAADPVGANSRLGIYTNFCNLFDLSAVAVPAGSADGGAFGVSVVARPFADRVAVDLAARLGGVAAPAAFGPPAVALLVVGAHRRGQPLDHQLTERGARYVATVHTAPAYKMYALDTQPPKPGLVRSETGGAAIEGELWELSPAALGMFLAALPAPMALGPITLATGRTVVGFGCEPAALDGALEITEHGSWPAYLGFARTNAPRKAGAA